MFLSGNTYNPHELRLRFGDNLIQRARVLRFLGVTLEERRTGVAQTTAILKGIRGAANAISCMARSRWGVSTPIILKAYKALVRRICYPLPYYSPSQTQLLKFERAHRVGLKRALGVPVQSATNQLYAEVHFLPIAVTIDLQAQS